MKHKEVNLQGSFHAYEGRPCEDSIVFDEAAGVYVVADGVSSASDGGKGARLRARGMAQWLANASVKELLLKGPAATIRSEVVCVLKTIDTAILDKLPGREKSDIASTLLCAVDLGGTICLIHCGDGVIFGVPAAEQTSVVILSAPDNAANGAVYYSGHPDQKERMRIIRVRSDDFSKLVLATDGFGNVYFEYPFVSNLDLLGELLDAPADDFDRLLTEHHKGVGDDISCIILETGAKETKTITAARNEYVRQPVKRPAKPSAGPVISDPNMRVDKGQRNRCTPTKRSVKPNKMVCMIATVVLIFLLAFESAALVQLSKRVRNLSEELQQVKASVSELEAECFSRKAGRITETTDKWRTKHERNKIMTNQDMDTFDKAWRFLEDHRIFGNRFRECLEAYTVKVDPKTRRINDNHEKNTLEQTWLECGPLHKKQPGDPPGISEFIHDFDLDCSGNTYEDAIIRLADKVLTKYGA